MNLANLRINTESIQIYFNSFLVSCFIIHVGLAEGKKQDDETQRRRHETWRKIIVVDNISEQNTSKKNSLNVVFAGAAAFAVREVESEGLQEHDVAANCPQRCKLSIKYIKHIK